MANKNRNVVKEAEVTDKDPSKMRGAFIRVTYENQTQDGVVMYTIQDIQDVLETWAKDKRMKYALICHHTHCHVIIAFNDATDFALIKKKFPYGRIERPKSTRNCVRYEVHADQQEKRDNDIEAYGRAYTIDDIITNDRKWVEGFFDTETKKVEDLIRENITVNSYIQNGLDLVTRGIITDKQYQKNKRFIEIRLEILYKTVILPKIKNRNINVIMVTSADGGTGKTSFIKEYFEMQGYTACIASDRDPMQMYDGEDVLILDDARDTTFKYREMLKLIDEFTGSPVGSRNVNRLFMGHTIVIITNQLLNDWYSYEISHAGSIGTENGTSFYRRIQQFWDFENNPVRVYNYKKPNVKATSAYTYFEFAYEFENPITDEWRRVNEPCEKVTLLNPKLASFIIECVTKKRNEIYELTKAMNVDNDLMRRAWDSITDEQKEVTNNALELQKQGVPINEIGCRIGQYYEQVACSMRLDTYRETVKIGDEVDKNDVGDFVWD